MKIDFSKIYNQYKGLWVALDTSLKTVISADKDAKKAYGEALRKGESQPTLFKVPVKNLPYFGSGI